MIFKFFANIFDRVLFTISFILGVQLPEFIQQYSQRIAGHLDEALNHLNQFQFIADTQYQGNLNTLITRYTQNNDPAIQQTGELVNNLITRKDLLTSHVNHLQDNDFFQRVFYFLKEVDLAIAHATYEQFVMAIPIELYALTCGAVFAFSIVWIKSVLTLCLSKTAGFVVAKIKPKPQVGQ